MANEKWLIDAKPIIERYSGGENMKSMAECIQDEIFVNVLRNAPRVDAAAEITEIDGVTIDLLKALAEHYKEGRLLVAPRPGDVLYEADGEHGVVKHTVTDVHWVANTSAVDDNGMAWADYYTEEDIKTAHQTREAAEIALLTVEG